MAQDVAAYRSAKAEDDGERVSLAEVRDELAGWFASSSSPPQPRGSCAGSTDRCASG